MSVTSLIVSSKHLNNVNNKIWFAGAGADFKVLQPLLPTSNNGLSYATNEKVNGLSFTAFLKHQTPVFTTKFQAIYDQNLYYLIVLGGYAVHSINDSLRHTVDYTALNNLSVWS